MEDAKDEESESAATSSNTAVTSQTKHVWPLSPAPRGRNAALQPLLFVEPAQEEELSCYLSRARDLPLPCVFCEKRFGEGCDGEGVKWESVRDQLLCHLLEVHKIVIHEVAQIASLRR